MQEEQGTDQQQREQFVMQRMHQVLTLLQEGLQEPFQLYTIEVIQKLMKDVPKLDAAPEISMIESIPNRGKVYYGEDIQMITLMKKKCLELKEKKCSVAQMTEKVAEWLEQYADIIIRTQFDQKWCEQQILVCIRLFKERFMKDQEAKAAQQQNAQDTQQDNSQQNQQEALKEGQVNITVTFDSLCGCAYVYKRSRNQALKNVIFMNLLPMVEVCINQQEHFLECIRQSAELKQSLQPQQAPTPSPEVEPAAEVEVAVPNQNEEKQDQQCPREQTDCDCPKQEQGQDQEQGCCEQKECDCPAQEQEHKEQQE